MSFGNPTSTASAFGTTPGIVIIPTFFNDITFI